VKTPLEKKNRSKRDRGPRVKVVGKPTGGSGGQDKTKTVRVDPLSVGGDQEKDEREKKAEREKRKHKGSTAMTLRGTYPSGVHTDKTGTQKGPGLSGDC